MASILSSGDPAHDGWHVDLYVLDIGSPNAAGFLAFHCVDHDDQMEVIEEALGREFVPLDFNTISAAQAHQVVDMFLREPKLRLIKGTVALRDGTASFAKLQGW